MENIGIEENNGTLENKGIKEKKPYEPPACESKSPLNHVSSTYYYYYYTYIF